MNISSEPVKTTSEKCKSSFICRTFLSWTPLISLRGKKSIYSTGRCAVKSSITMSTHQQSRTVDS